MAGRIKKLATPMHAIVQHSGYGYAKKFDFKKGLESSQVETQSEVDRVASAKGILFGDYLAAEEYCMKEMYPEGVGPYGTGDSIGLIPQAPGSFSEVTMDGLAIYVPLEVLDKTEQN